MIQDFLLFLSNKTMLARGRTNNNEADVNIYIIIPWTAMHVHVAIRELHSHFLSFPDTVNLLVSHGWSRSCLPLTGTVVLEKQLPTPPS
jgi:hypothetical protein